MTQSAPILGSIILVLLLAYPVLLLVRESRQKGQNGGNTGPEHAQPHPMRDTTLAPEYSSQTSLTQPQNEKAEEEASLRRANTAGESLENHIRGVVSLLDQGAKFIVLSGPGRPRNLLEKLDELMIWNSNEASPRDDRWHFSRIIDLAATRADAVEICEDISKALGRTQLGDFRNFNRKLAAYRSKAEGRTTTSDKIGAGAQQLTAAALSLAPGVGQALSNLATSQVATDFRTELVDRFQGSGAARDVYEALVEDTSSAVRASNSSRRIVLLLDGIDARPDDRAMQILTRQVLPALRGQIAIVASASNDQVELGQGLNSRKSYWLPRLTEEVVRTQLADLHFSAKSILKIASAIQGDPDRLASVLDFTRRKMPEFDSQDVGAEARYVGEAIAWAEGGRVPEALSSLRTEYRPLALAVSALRWFNAPLLDQVAEETGLLSADVNAAELLNPEHQTTWIAADQQGWRIADHRLRTAMLTEFRRSEPRLVRVVHQTAAEYHRRELWASSDLDEPASECITNVPKRRLLNEIWSDWTRTNEIEWLHHRFAMDSEATIALALDRAAEAMQSGDRQTLSALASVGLELQLKARDEYVLKLMHRLGDELSDDDRPWYERVRELRQFVPRNSVAYTILLCLEGVSLVNAERPGPALARLSEAYLAAQEPAEDPRAIRVACLSQGIRGLIMSEGGWRASGSHHLSEALQRAKESGDVGLVAELYKCRARAAAAAGWTESEQEARSALMYLGVNGGSAAVELLGSLRSQLADALTFRKDPDYSEAESILRTSLGLCVDLGDRDGEVSALCQISALSLLRERYEVAKSARAEALSKSAKPSETYSALGLAMTWHQTTQSKSRAVGEFRAACASELLERPGLRSREATSSSDLLPRISIADLNALLSIYENDIGDLDAADRYRQAARQAIPEMSETAKTLIGEAKDLSDVDHMNARIDLEKNVLAQPGDRTIRASLARALIAEVYVREDYWSWSEADRERAWAPIVDALKSAQAPSQDEPETVFDLEHALRQTGAEEEAAELLQGLIRRLRSKIAEDPKEAELYASLGKCQARQGNYEDSVDSYKSAKRLDNTSMRLVDLSHALSSAGRWAEATDLLSVRLLQGDYEPELLDEAIRLFGLNQDESSSREGAPLDDNEQIRLGELVKALPTNPLLSLCLARSLAARARAHAQARLETVQSKDPDFVGGSIVPTPTPSPQAADEAITLFKVAAAGPSTGVAPLLEAVELLLDLAEFEPERVSSAMELLRDHKDKEGIRSAKCLARIVEFSGRDAEEARELLRLRREETIAARVQNLPKLEGAVDDDVEAQVRLVVGDGLVDDLNPNKVSAAQRLYEGGGMIDSVRLFLAERVGLECPGVRVRGSRTSLEPDEVALFVNGAPRGRFFLSRYATTALPSNVEQIIGEQPARGFIGTQPMVWLSEAQAESLDHAGEETLSTRGLVCLLIGEYLWRFASEVVDAQRMSDASREGQASDAGSSSGRMGGASSLGFVTGVARRLLGDGVPIVELPRMIAKLGSVERLNFRDIFASDFSVLRPDIQAGLMHPIAPSATFSVEEGVLLSLLEEAPEQQNLAPPCTLALNRRRVAQIRTWARSIPEEVIAVVVPSIEYRVRLRELLRACGLPLRVVAQEELPVDTLEVKMMCQREGNA